MHVNVYFFFLSQFMKNRTAIQFKLGIVLFRAILPSFQSKSRVRSLPPAMFNGLNSAKSINHSATANTCQNGLCSLFNMCKTFILQQCQSSNPLMARLTRSRTSMRPMLNMYAWMSVIGLSKCQISSLMFPRRLAFGPKYAIKIRPMQVRAFKLFLSDNTSFIAASASMKMKLFFVI